MTDLIKDSLLEELVELNRWFSELKAALGLSPKADRGRVLANMKRLCEEKEVAKEQQQLVASYCGHKYWGGLVAAAEKAGEGMVVTIKLTEEFDEVPVDWVRGPGKPSYDTARKQLPNTQKLVKKVFAYLETKREVEGDGWFVENRRRVTEAFVNSQSWEQLNQDLWEFYNEVDPEPEPSEMWRQAAKESRNTLEYSTNLPPVAVAELLNYAETEGVEVTKKHSDWVQESNFAERHWFNYLLCAYLTKQQRPGMDSIERVTEEVRQAARISALYSTAWDPTATLADINTVYNTYKCARRNEGNADDIEETVRAALGRRPTTAN